MKKETKVKEGNRRGSEQSGVVFALYMQSVKKCVRETNAVRLKVTTECTGETREKGKVCGLGGSVPDGNSLQKHKEETSGSMLLWNRDNYSMMQKKKKITFQRKPTNAICIFMFSRL